MSREDIFEEQEYLDMGLKPKRSWIKTVLKFIGFSLVLFIYLFFFLRICSSGDTQIAKRLIWTETMIAAYQNDPDNFSVYELEVPSYITENGYFAASNVRYVEATGGIQVTIRYNNSTLNALQTELKIEEITSSEPFVFALKDNNGNIYTDYQYLTDEKWMYNYRRLVFEGVKMQDVSSLTVHIYFRDGFDYDYDAKSNAIDIYQEPTDGFIARNVEYTEEGEILSLCVEYGEDIRKMLSSKYALEAIPMHPFTYVIKDSFGNVYTEGSYEMAEIGGKKLDKVVFSGIDMEEVSSLSMYIYYADDFSKDNFNLKEFAYGSIFVFKNGKFISGPEWQLFDYEKEMYENDRPSEGLLTEGK